MSKDYNIFLKNAENIRSTDFDHYAFSLGFQIRISPLKEYVSHSGFLQFNIRPSFIDPIFPYDSLLSGFEVYFSQYRCDDFDGEFKRVMSGTRYTLLILINGDDSFQELIAAVFAGYLCKYCGGILYDPQEDKIYSDLADIEVKCNAEKAKLVDISNKQSFMVYNFTGWD